MFFYCEECCEIFSDEEAEHRDAELGDSVPKGTKIAICPYCGSDDLIEADTCERCGTPIVPGEHLCDGCEGDLYGAVQNIVESFHGDVADAKENFVGYLERRWL